MKDPQRRQRVTRRRTPHPPATPSARARRGAGVAARGYSLSAPTTPVLAAVPVGGYGLHGAFQRCARFAFVFLYARARTKCAVCNWHTWCVRGGCSG